MANGVFCSLFTTHRLHLTLFLLLMLEFHLFRRLLDDFDVVFFHDFDLFINHRRDFLVGAQCVDSSLISGRSLDHQPRTTIRIYVGIYYCPIGFFNQNGQCGVVGSELVLKVSFSSRRWPDRVMPNKAPTAVPPRIAGPLRRQ